MNTVEKVRDSETYNMYRGKKERRVEGREGRDERKEGRKGRKEDKGGE